METLKRLEDIQKPDERNLYWVFLSTNKQVGVEDRYAAIASISVNASAPEDVRSYFVTLQNLCVYGWFSYDFYALVVFLSYTFIEMALKHRLPLRHKGQDKRTLKPLLQEAIKLKLIKAKAFTHIKRMRQEQAQNLRMFRRVKTMMKSGVPKNDYLAVLLETLPNLRNSFAHPSGQSIHFPHDATFALRFAADFVNQLFPMP
jgi:hypothetical protein